jgi:hypothetical protein
MTHASRCPDRPWSGALLAAALLAHGASAVAAEDPAWASEARKVAVAVPPKLLSTLTAAIDQGGPEGAIEVCRDEAPKLARAASEASGWSIRRVSLKQRNAKAVPDDWERAVLQDFDRRAAAGESPATLEKTELVVVAGQAQQRYMRALPVQQMCLACHGPADSLSPAVSAQLKALYPDDQGVGYRVGELRGAITLKRPQ